MSLPVFIWPEMLWLLLLVPLLVLAYLWALITDQLSILIPIDTRNVSDSK